VTETVPETGMTVPLAMPCTVMTSADADPAVPSAGCFAAVDAPVGNADRVTSTSRPFVASPPIAAVPSSAPSTILIRWYFTPETSSVAIVSPPVPGSSVVLFAIF
jgi:hypothetical protein